MSTFEINNAIDTALKKVELVAAYVRVSHQEQKLHGLSLDAQKMKLQEYADKNNMKIVEWYLDEGVSGRKLIRNRPALQRMIQDAEKKKFDRIIFIKLDRFFRSVAEYHECMKRIAPIIWTATEEPYDLTTANGRMMVNMKLTIAELEADQTGERIDLVNEYKASTGQPLTGAMPFGFKIVTDELTGRKKIIKHPDYKDIVEDMLDYLFTHQSKRKAVLYLKNKHHISLCYNSLCNLVKNTMLCGEYRGNTNYCEKYLTREQFDRLQEITSRNVKSNTRKRDYIFSGLLVCPVCGRKLAGSIQTTQRAGGKVFHYKGYRCHNHGLNKQCTFNKVILETTLQRKMLASIEQYLSQAKLQSFEITAGTETVPKYDIEELHAQIDRLNYSWTTGKIRSVELYEKQYDELMAKLEEAEAEQGETAVQDFSHIEKILQAGWQDIYNALDDAHKMAFWRSFIRQIEIEWTTDVKEITNIKFF
ncbi:MAG: recombinase family protein [Oscillospiraceae bacterium]|nr:recombinase family protein [Oscillospiraceae bacterium]